MDDGDSWVVALVGTARTAMAPKPQTRGCLTCLSVIHSFPWSRFMSPAALPRADPSPSCSTDGKAGHPRMK